MHPLVQGLDQLKDSELDQKISDLTRKYFSTHNFDLQQQIAMILESYKEEQSRRQRAALERLANTRNKELDKLIKVD